MDQDQMWDHVLENATGSAPSQGQESSGMNGL